MAKALVSTQRRMARYLYQEFLALLCFYLLINFIVREEKRKAKRLRKMGLTEEEEMAEKIGIEERKLLIAQRKLESIRVLDELLERVKVISGFLSFFKVFSAG